MSRAVEVAELLPDAQNWTIFDRRNPTKEALGQCYRFTLCDHDFVGSSDRWKWWGQAIFTAAVIAANMYSAWPHLGWVEFLTCCGLCVVAFTSSRLVNSTDPGIYPRLQEGEADPLGHDTTLIYCKRCRLRRPPRTSHCYVCDVCVREHDHHCEILGGCVGIRSLRWFVLFLLSASASCCMGLFWMIRSTITSRMFTESDATARVNGTTRAPLDDSEFVREFVTVTTLMVDACVILLVGGFGCFYVGLTLTSTTRRESKQNQASLSTLLKPRRVWRNGVRAAFPPPSMVVSDDSPIQNTPSSPHAAADYHS